MEPRYPFHTDGLAPVQPAINRRINKAMRELVDLANWAADCGHIEVKQAGIILERAGVPMEVACRVLPKRRAHQ